MREQYDTIVIGAGQAGGPLAGALARAGRRTALVERAHVGGTCINEGCTPTKTMVASAAVANLARRGAGFGVPSSGVRIDMPAVRERKRRIVDEFRGGSERRLAGSGVDLIRGNARYGDARTILVRMPDGRERELESDRSVINVGARPSRPAIPGVETVAALDSTSIMELDAVPSHLVILGGGYVGLEFAQMFRRFGSAVTIIQRSGHLLSREDTDVADAVAGILQEDGIEILLNASISHVEGANHGATVICRVGDAERRVTGSHLLLALGRTPNTDTLELDAAGVATDTGGFVRVTDTLETTTPNIYAVGDVKGGPAFTHIAYDDYRILRANLLHSQARSTAGRLVPYTVFIDPQLGRVGLTESEARAAGRAVRVATMPMNHVARALEMDESRGFMKVLIDSRTDLILGVAVLGVEGGEIMGAIQIAMMGSVTASMLSQAIFAHPTLLESLNNLFAIP